MYRSSAALAAVAAYLPLAYSISASIVQSPQQIAYPPSTLLGSAPTCQGVQTSCTNTTAVSDSCCFNAPSGLMIQAQYWVTSPAAGGAQNWTINGLFPDHCDGSYDSQCDANRNYTDITNILIYYNATTLLANMRQYWPALDGNNEAFWQKQFSDYGTCISTLNPGCYTNYAIKQEVVDYFRTTMNLYFSLPSYALLANASIVPSTDKTYSLADIETALSANTGMQAIVGCAPGSVLNEIWYFNAVSGNVQGGNYVAVSPIGVNSTCPDTGIKYLPKNTTNPVQTATSGTSTKPSATTTTKPTGFIVPTLPASSTKYDINALPTGASSTSTAAAPTKTAPIPFFGLGKINVILNGAVYGCLDVFGVWNIGNCNTWTANPPPQSGQKAFEIVGNQGPCTLRSNQFICGDGNVAVTYFNSSGNFLQSRNNTEWYAPAVITGTGQLVLSTVYSDVTVQLQWSSTSGAVQGANRLSLQK